MKNRIILGVFVFGIILTFYYLFSSGLPYDVQKTQEQITYKKTMIDMESSPLKDSSIVQFFNPDKAFQIKAKFKKNSSKVQVNMTDASMEEARQAGIVTFYFNKKKYEVIVFEEGETLMFPFKDLSNGSKTYGGGRYLNINKVMDDAVVLDFNDARNFYCAYSKDFVCPIPPKQNSLPFEVSAGEMNVK